MCGIAGWIDFKRDLTGERKIAHAMTASMALRGPDDEGLWLSPHAAIGHRRLAVIDIEGGVQPMVAEEDDVVLTYSGEVYNYRELRAELSAAGHRFRTASDTEVVLRAYMEWGVECVNRLNGMYAFGVWDGRTEQLLLVRDRLGIKPLFYYPLPGGVLFGSEPKAILANPLAERVVDPQGLCSIFSMARTPGLTAFRGLMELQPGHYRTYSRSGSAEREYWKLEARPHEDDLPTTVGKIRDMLEDIMCRQLIADVPLSMLLSGGLDSSALTALAQGTDEFSASGNSVRSFAVDFTGNAENFRPSELRDALDGPFADEVARHVGSDHQSIMLDTESLLDPSARLSVLRAMDLPSHSADMDISLFLLFQAIREHSTVAISGEAADEVFGGYPWMHDQAVLEIPMFPWMAAAIKDGSPSLVKLFDASALQRIGIGEYVFGLYSDSLAEVPHLEEEEEEEHRMREVMYQHLTRFLPNLLDRKDRTSMATGLEVRVPFCDHRLVEYVFNIPWSMKTSDGREKSLLREATRDLLPDSVVERRKAIFPTTHDARYDDGLRAELKRILDGKGDEPVREFLDEEGTRELVAETSDKTASSWSRMPLEGALRVNMWLKEYDLDVVDV